MIIPTPALKRIPYRMQGMSPFRQILHRWSNPPRYLLIEDYVITLDDGLQLVHPRGFVVDGASVPRLLWPIIEPTGPLLEGSVPHDMYYQHGYLLARREPGRIFNLASQKLSRESCRFGDLVPVFIGRGQAFGDRLLRDITIEKHGATVDANRAYRALRIFGKKAWNKYRSEGPGAFNTNSLGLPGINKDGEAFVHAA